MSTQRVYVKMQLCVCQVLEHIECMMMHTVPLKNRMLYALPPSLPPSLPPREVVNHEFTELQQLSARVEAASNAVNRVLRGQIAE